LNLNANLQKYLEGGRTAGRMPNARYASFDYCFNYFQSFRESRSIPALASPANLQLSCLHLGFYLASWGMFRGSTSLLQRSARHLIPVIEMIANTDAPFWEIDLDSYTESNIEQVCEQGRKVWRSLPGMSDALLTKIMLGVFGCVPAFDTNFRGACRATGIVGTFGAKALKQIGALYNTQATVLDEYRVPTLDFITGKPTKRRYSRAKVMDMAFFIEGERLERVSTRDRRSSGSDQSCSTSHLG
jgi:hypothetical protein